MKILIIDNYDSFTYNLVQMIGSKGNQVFVLRNDQNSLEEILDFGPDKIMISPGPGRPENSGLTLSVLKEFETTHPVLGVCLGHQAIGYILGSEIISGPELMHGKTSRIIHDGKTIFSGIPQNFDAMRYHSLVINPDTLSSELTVSAYTEDGTIMGVRHNSFPLEGIQFHPESILTIEGEKIIDNWLSL
ncbi:MAG: aminodeoxychorismate/anthranilate synthase component II [Ignavibacteriales bacterium]|nr:MAG: aminodeoxychorismate/anthranilate synthase component II [Ignavibacteriales bacterium]